MRAEVSVCAPRCRVLAGTLVACSSPPATSTAPCSRASTCSSARRCPCADDGRAPGRAAGPGEPPAVPLARGPAGPLRPVRRHPRAGGAVAGAAADDARHHPPAGAGRRADAARVDPAGARAGAQGQPEHPRRRCTSTRARCAAAVDAALATDRCRSGRSARRWRSGSRTSRRTRSATSRASTYPWPSCRPRGCWRRSGGVVYDRVDRWLGRPQRRRTRRRSCGATSPRSARRRPPTSRRGRR